MAKSKKEEHKLEESYNKGEWRSIKPSRRQLSQYQKFAREALVKDKRINIRLTSSTLEALQLRAIEEGIPYQTLISSILHKYVTGRLKNNSETA